MMDTEQEGSIYLEFTTNDGGHAKTWLSYRSDGEEALDGRDAHKLMPLMASSRLTAMSFSGENSLDINNLPFEQEGTIEVPLDIMSLSLEDGSYVTNSKEVTMNWNLDQLPDHIDIILVDNITGQEVDLQYEVDYTFATEPKGSFSASYDGAIGIYPLVDDTRFTLEIMYSALVNDSQSTIPTAYLLDPIYPNPFNPRATVRFDVPKVSRVELQVYDIKGSLVQTLMNEKIRAGSHRYIWEPRGLSTGIYFLKLTTANQTFTQKVTYVK